jgi:ATP-binding cassette subfamily E protein 1
VAHCPTFKDEGMNRFMKQLDVTIRQDADTLRPRINKANSQLDQEQKKMGQYYMQTKSHIKEDEKKGSSN